MEYLIIILIILEIIRIKKKSNNLEVNYKQMYKPRKYLITLNELKFYKILIQIAEELNLVVFAQVSLYNILETQDKLDYQTKERFFKRIASKSIDFVLADPENCRIKLCIELDDSTHNLPNRIERDNFLNELFRQLEIDLLRYPVYEKYYKDTLKKRIQDNIKEHIYTN